MGAVLVVDDDAGIRQLVGLILRQKGYDVLTASNGLEGLMVYSTYRSRIDLVLTDIDMPEMNGIELSDRIRDRDPSKKILMMTGRPPDDSNCLKGPPIVLKPFRPDELIQVIEELLRA
jgi:CheY-like chemotaxis protein